MGHGTQVTKNGFFNFKRHQLYKKNAKSKKIVRSEDKLTASWTYSSGIQLKRGGKSNISPYLRIYVCHHCLTPPYCPPQQVRLKMKIHNSSKENRFRYNV